jgi:hypothetical protein
MRDSFRIARFATGPRKAARSGWAGRWNFITASLWTLSEDGRHAATSELTHPLLVLHQPSRNSHHSEADLLVTAITATTPEGWRDDRKVDKRPARRLCARTVLLADPAAEGLGLGEAKVNPLKSAEPTIARAIRDVLAVLTLAGIAGLVMALAISFEEANTPMVILSGAMILSAPATALLHVCVTRGLTRNEKQFWLKEFRGPEVWSTLSEYLSSPNLSESARRRAQEAVARRTSK